MEWEVCLRDLYDMLSTRLDLGVPPEAIQPIVDHFGGKVLTEWDAEFVGRSSEPPGIAEPTEG